MKFYKKIYQKITKNGFIGRFKVITFTITLQLKITEIYLTKKRN